MSRLENLLKKLCPHGVPFDNLVNVSNILYGYPCNAKQFNDNNHGLPLIRIRDVLSGMTNTYTTENIPSEYIIHKGDLLVGMDGNFHVGNWKDREGVLCQRVCKISSKDETVILNRFLSHYLPPVMKLIELSKPSGTVKHLLAKDINSIKIPIPPLEVQEEIVRILDTFTELTAELTAELIARKKQYEYYKEKLFTFKDSVAEMKPLGHEFSFIRNGFVGTATPYYTTKEDGVRYLKGTNVHNGVISDNEEEYITQEFHQKHIKNQLKADDILVVQSGHVGECAVVGDKYAGANCHALIIMSNGGNCNSRYVAYYLQTIEGKRKLERITTGGTIKHILASGMKKLAIPFPPIEVQNEIVEVLDRFSTLCNDISAGLPAEIEARKKQYEYYRDKLLTFKEMS